jgi:tetrapyrrole methylase family protein / MazG family protein
MKEFDELMQVADVLMGDNGCVWDKKQTMESISHYFLEEAKELIEGIEKKDTANIIEESGDLLYTIIFLSKIASKNNLFSIEEVLKKSKEKLIRRHPHVFGDEVATNEKDVEKIWLDVKAKEKAGDYS